MVVVDAICHVGVVRVYITANASRGITDSKGLHAASRIIALQLPDYEAELGKLFSGLAAVPNSSL
jgi:hypothetical protein